MPVRPSSVCQTHGLTRNAAMQSILHAGWNVRMPLPAIGQLVAPQHQVTRARQRVLLLRKPLGTINAVNNASCAIRSVRISGMTRLTLIGAILADHGSQSMLCLAVVACRQTLPSMQGPLIDSSPRRLPSSAQTLPRRHHQHSVYHAWLRRLRLLHI